LRDLEFSGLVANALPKKALVTGRAGGSSSGEVPWLIVWGFAAGVAYVLQAGLLVLGISFLVLFYVFSGVGRFCPRRVCSLAELANSRCTTAWSLVDALVQLGRRYVCLRPVPVVRLIAFTWRLWLHSDVFQGLSFPGAGFIFFDRAFEIDRVRSQGWIAPTWAVSGGRRRSRNAS
jgi:hypothetical protein